MSVQATSWVWSYSQSEGNARLVLLAIADGANREGNHSCQSISTIAEMCRLSQRTVHRKILELVELGEIQKVGTSGQYGTQVYDLTTLSPCQIVTPDKSGDTLCQNEHHAMTPLADNPINPNIAKAIYPREGEQSSHAPKKKQASSLPEGWMPDQTVIDQIRRELAQAGRNINFEMEHRKFTDYFQSVSGAKGRKKDWNAAWRNWMRRAGDFAPRNRDEYKPGYQKRGEYYMNQMQKNEVIAWTNQIEA